MNIITQIAADTISVALCWHKQTQHYLQQIYSNAWSQVWKKQQQILKCIIQSIWDIPGIYLFIQLRCTLVSYPGEQNLKEDCGDIAQLIRCSATRHLWSIFHNYSSTNFTSRRCCHDRVSLWFPGLEEDHYSPCQMDLLPATATA